MADARVLTYEIFLLVFTRNVLIGRCSTTSKIESINGVNPNFRLGEAR